MLFAPSRTKSTSFRGPLPGTLRHGRQQRMPVQGMPTPTRGAARSQGLRRVHRFLELAGACILMTSFLVLALFA